MATGLLPKTTLEPDGCPVLLRVTGELKPEDVRVLYFENDGIKSTVHDVEFATDGQIKGAPKGFFDTYGIDVMSIAMNAIG